MPVYKIIAFVDDLDGVTITSIKMCVMGHVEYQKQFGEVYLLAADDKEAKKRALKFIKQDIKNKKLIDNEEHQEILIRVKELIDSLSPVSDNLPILLAKDIENRLTNIWHLDKNEKYKLSENDFKFKKDILDYFKTTLDMIENDNNSKDNSELAWRFWQVYGRLEDLWNTKE